MNIKRDDSAAEKESRLGSALSACIENISDTGSCPSPEEIARFIEGSCQEPERDSLMRHLAGCDRCREIFLTARLLEQSDVVEIPGRKRWYLASVCAVAAVALLVLQFSLKSGPETPTQIAVKPSEQPVQQAASAPVRPEPVPSAAALKQSVSPTTAAVAPPVLLLSAEEAALPEAGRHGFVQTSENEGPDISVDETPQQSKQGESVSLRIRFRQKEAAVDPASLRLECLKNPPIDLTDRVKPYSSVKGVYVEKVKLPPGRYRFRVKVADVNGKLSEKDFAIFFGASF